MDDLSSQIRAKMEAAGLSAAAIRAFLYQYRKLEKNEAGLIPENSISPLGTLSSIEDETVSGDRSDVAAQTVVLKLNGGLGTGMGLEKAKSLLSPGRTYLSGYHRSPVFIPALGGRSAAQTDSHEQLQHQQRYRGGAGGLSRTWRSQTTGVDAEQSAKD